MLNAVIPVQEIKRRGMGAVDSGLRQYGSVIIVRNNRPAYVVLSPADYEAMAQAADEARLSQGLADWQAGRCAPTTVDDLLREAATDE
jgi:PHD/YefM family antitoxin component YafN of YafNO toxin-antitoxin module